jgi:hypothetical protein
VQSSKNGWSVNRSPSIVDQGSERNADDLFFGGEALRVGLRIARILSPERVLVLSSRLSSLSDSLREQGIDVTDMHLSSFSGSEASGPESMHGLADGKWDLIVCLDSLQQVTPEVSDELIDALCSAGGQILVFSAPTAAAAADQVATKSNAGWAAAFAERDYFRRIDVDLNVTGSWVALFESGSMSVRDLVFRYESELEPIQSEVMAKRAVVIDQRGKLDAETDGDTQKLITELRHQILTSRDFAIGAEAELARLRAERDRLQSLVAEIYASARWRVGAGMMNPLSRLKNGVDRLR